MPRKYKVTINNTLVDIEVERSKNGILTIKIGDTSFPVQVTDLVHSGKYKITVGDTAHTVHLSSNQNTPDFTVKVDKEIFTASLKPITEITPRSIRFQATPSTPSTIAPTPQTPTPTIQEPIEPGTVTAPLPGRILEVRIKEGMMVKTGDVLLVLEAMKMANEIRAPQNGTVHTVHVEVGAVVEKGQAMITIQ